MDLAQSLGNRQKGSTYRGLFLRHIHQRCAHRGRENDIPMTLLLKDPSGRLSRIERAVKVHLHNLAPLAGRVVLSRYASRNSRVGDHDIQFPKILGHLLHSRLNLSLVRDIGLVCSGLYIMGRRDFSRGCFGCL